MSDSDKEDRRMSGEDGDEEEDEEDDLLDDILTLHEDILEENEEGVKEILGDFAEDQDTLLEICTREVRVDQDPWPMTCLHRAAAIGNTSVLELLLNACQDIDINKGVKHNGLTALHLATWEGQTPMVSYLAANGANVNATDIRGRTAMHLAAENGHRDVAQILGVKGARSDIADKNAQTPLHSAAKRGTARMVSFLLKRGVSVNAQDSDGQTPLHRSLSSGRLDVVAMMLSHHADVTIQDNKGNTPLHTAIGAPRKISDGRRASVDIQNGRPTDGVPEDVFQRGPVQLLLDAKSQVNVANNDGDAPLHLAARIDELDSVQLLLRRDAEVNAKNNAGETPLFACRTVDCFLLFIEGGVDLTALDLRGNCSIHSFAANEEATHDLIECAYSHDADVDVVNVEGQTPLFNACRVGNVKKINVLIDADVKTDVRDSKGQTALFTAITTRRPNVVQLLIDRCQVDVNVRDKEGRTPLHLAVICESAEIVRILLGCGADVNCRDNFGESAASYAMTSDTHDMFRMLVQAGAAVDETAVGSESPLNLFARLNDLPNVQRLVEQDLDLNKKNKRGRTPLHDALTARAWQVTSYLLSKGARADTVDLEKDTPLHAAARLCTGPEIFKMLFKNGAHANESNKQGDTALHVCTQIDQPTAILKDFMSNGANPIATNTNKSTPVHIAISRCSPDQECLEKAKCLMGTMGGRELDMRDGAGRCFIHIAAERGFSKVAQYLLDSGANCRLTDTKGRSPLHYACIRPNSQDTVSVLLDCEISLDNLDKNGASALYYAVESNSVESVRLLLEKGANPVVHGGDSMYPLHLALIKGFTEVLELLLLGQCEVDVAAVDKEGRSALHLAVRRSHRLFVSSLLALGSDPNLKDANGQTPLHHACYNNDVSVLQELIKRDADVDAADNAGNTALHISSERGSYNHVDQLISADADIEMENETGQTPVHHAAKAEESDVLELLIANEADVNTSDAKGQTPLLVALSLGHLDHAGILLNQRADTSHVDQDGQSALHKVARLRTAPPSIIQSLARRGSCLLACDREGKTPLDIAEGDVANFMQSLLP